MWTSKLLQLLHVLWNVQGLLIAVVLGALIGQGLRALLLGLLGRGRGKLVILRRLLGAAFWGLLAAGYGLLTAAMMHWNARALIVATLAALAMLSSVLIWQVGLGRPLRLSLVSLLGRATLILALLLLLALSLMRSGFVALTTDRPVLRVEVTGETRLQKVRWAAPDEPLQEQSLSAHRILLRTVDTSPPKVVAEAWLYGDQAAIKGRVLRLSALLNVAGIENLFELSFIHNGYFTAERHSHYPHQAQALQSLGPLAVHPRFRPLRDWLLAHWEKSSTDEHRAWAIRAATTESTYFPLVNAQGQPLHQSFELVLTPGGLSAR